MSTPAIVNAFTVDVEDYYQVSAFADRIDRRQWDRFESRVVANTHRVLRLLDRCQTRGTFFILGWVAERHPDLVRDIQRSGHEIGCHSYSHRLIYEMTPDDFRADLRRANDAIGSVTGTAMTAYRAPSFSITNQSLWAIDILIEEGIRHDSSVFPVHHDRYGIPGAPRFPNIIERPSGQLLEFPPTVCAMGPLKIPVSGGGYFRLFPYWFTAYGLAKVNRRERQPGMFYIHPWELDPDQPRLPGSLRSRFRHYQNLKSTESKLEKLLRRFSWDSMEEVLRQSIPSASHLVPRRHSNTTLTERSAVLDTTD